jgi:hypothetical protein
MVVRRGNLWIGTYVRMAMTSSQPQLLNYGKRFRGRRRPSAVTPRIPMGCENARNDEWPREELLTMPWVAKNATQQLAIEDMRKRLSLGIRHWEEVEFGNRAADERAEAQGKGRNGKGRRHWEEVEFGNRAADARAEAQGKGRNGKGRPRLTPCQPQPQRTLTASRIAPKGLHRIKRTLVPCQPQPQRALTASRSAPNGLHRIKRTLMPCQPQPRMALTASRRAPKGLHRIKRTSMPCQPRAPPPDHLLGRCDISDFGAHMTKSRRLNQAARRESTSRSRRQSSGPHADNRPVNRIR